MELPTASWPGHSTGPIVVALVGLVALACGEPAGPEGPVGPASVTVTSPVDTVVAPGVSAQLTATAFSADGAALPGTSFTWGTSDPSVLGVDASGAFTAQSVGSAAVTATADGGGMVSGSLALRVADADLTAIGDFLA